MATFTPAEMTARIGTETVSDWVEVTLAAEDTLDTWRQWSYTWNATAGRHTIRVRATDTDGNVQTDQRAEPIPDGASGHHQIVVIAE